MQIILGSTGPSALIIAVHFGHLGYFCVQFGTSVINATRFYSYFLLKLARPHDRVTARDLRDRPAAPMTAAMCVRPHNSVDRVLVPYELKRKTIKIQSINQSIN